MSTTLSILLSRSPMLLTQIAALVVCLALWRRAPQGVIYAAAGIGLFILNNLVSVLSTVWLMQNRSGASPAPGYTIGQVMLVFQIAGMILHAGGLALLVTGVFAGRPSQEPGGFEVTPVQPIDR